VAKYELKKKLGARLLCEIMLVFHFLKFVLVLLINKEKREF